MTQIATERLSDLFYFLLRRTRRLAIGQNDSQDRSRHCDTDSDGTQLSRAQRHAHARARNRAATCAASPTAILVLVRRLLTGVGLRSLTCRAGLSLRVSALRVTERPQFGHQRH